MKYKLDPKKFEAFCWYHLLDEMQHPIGDFHRELINLISSPRIAIAAPRGFAKSTYFSFFYALFAALECPGIKIMLISATGELASSWLLKIRNHLDFNEKIEEFYGRQAGDKWTSEELHLANGSVIMAKGAGKQIRGFRPNLVVGDDLETDEMVISKEQREKFDQWFWKSLLGTVPNNGQIIIIGTLLHPESFLAELLKAGRPGWKTKLYSAEKQDGTALWPDEWPLEKLRARREEIGTYAYQQEYLNDPIPDELRTFQKKWFQTFDKEPQGCVYFTTVDPAISLSDTADSTAIVTCAIDPEGKIYVVETINKRMLPSETIDEIFNAYKRWDSSVVGIETIGYQKKLKYDMEQERKRRKSYPVLKELKDAGRRKHLRIEALQPFFEAGQIYIKENQTELQTQLLRFPSARCKDDIIDALAYQLDIFRPARGVKKSLDPMCFKARYDDMKSRRKGSNIEVWGNHNLMESVN